MASNKIGDSDTNCQIKQTDCPVDCDTPNATNGDSSTSDSHKFFRRILKYFTRPTAQIRQSKKKKCDIKKQIVSTSKSEEKISIYTSLSSIVDNVIKPDAEIVVKRRTVDAITSTTRVSNVFDKVTHENLSDAIERFIHGASYRYAKYAAKDVDNVVSDRGCGPLYIDSGTQSVTVDGEFSLETSPDTFAEACEKRRHADFILEEIAKVSDALTQKARLASAKEQAASILASISMAPTKYEMEEQTFESTKSLISSIIHAEEEPIVIVKEKPIVIVEEKSTVVVGKKPSVVVEEKPTIVIEKKPSVIVEKKPSVVVERKPTIVVEKKPSVVVEREPTIVVEKKPSVVVEEKPTAVAVAVTSTTVMQPEIHKEILESPPNHFTPNSRDFSVSLQLDKSLSALDVQVKPSIEDLRKTERTRTALVTFPEKDDLRDTAAPFVTSKKTEEKEKLPKKNSLRRMLDKHGFTDMTHDENCVIINCIPKLKKKRPKSLDQPDDTLRQKDTQTGVSRKKVVKRVDSSIKPSKMKKELAQKTKDIPQEPVPYKKPKYRAKYRIDMKKKEKKPQLKKAPHEILKHECLISLPEMIRSSKVFEDFVRPTTKMYQDCRRTLSEYLEPTRYCKDLSSICLTRPNYCDVWITPSVSSESTINGAFPQDSCTIKYRASCHSLIDSSSRYRNINTDCTKRRVTFENSLCTNMYCKNDAKYCYPHLNNIDNVRMRYYHCNDICPVLNNNQQCGTDRSYYWTKGNLYFTHPWTSEHLLRYN
ncbi:PREDICTED: uncharacterized protein LOC108758879 [Trachymyrmex cornetzi]|uniref:Signal transducer and activator of transcription 2 n=1 Tax=Trachymyrmex cornetzi TaxID=471704 RepID=A0A195ECX3_9HYME|nr:PREDICTED: uncharacterized protein LOC108758879 [Trachymyrmex cornetzi]KYN22961.1 Signal transducer and activator of transcription 2 [Trachymyrmex cornetzi]